MYIWFWIMMRRSNQGIYTTGILTCPKIVSPCPLRDQCLHWRWSSPLIFIGHGPLPKRDSLACVINLIKSCVSKRGTQRTRHVQPMRMWCRGNHAALDWVCQLVTYPDRLFPPCRSNHAALSTAYTEYGVRSSISARSLKLSDVAPGS